MTLLAILLGRMNYLSTHKGMEYIAELEKIPSKVEKILALNEDIREIATTIKDCKNALYLGRGINYPVAMEGALKLKEISIFIQRSYQTAEMKHESLL